MPEMLEHHAAPAHPYSCLCISYSPPPNPAGGALVPEMLEQRHAEFLADAQQFLLRGGQVGVRAWAGTRLGLRAWLPSQTGSTVLSARRVGGVELFTCTAGKYSMFTAYLPCSLSLLYNRTPPSLQAPLVRTVYRRTAFQESSNNQAS